jgi:hypothetical protein
MKVTLEGALSLLSKSKYTVQHFIDQHPALFAAIFPVYFITLWIPSRRNHQLHRRVAFIVEDLSHTSSVPRSEMGRAERADATADEL